MASIYHLKRKLQKEILMKGHESALPQPTMFPGGKTFFVDGSSGSNSNDGTTRALPFLTITHALTKCTTKMHDTIYVRDDNENASETWPIVINKQNVHIIGLSNPYSQRCTIRPTGDTQAITCGGTGYGSEFANIDFGGGNSYACIELTSTGKVWIHDCQFGGADCADTPLHGILATEHATICNAMIEDCVFHGDLEGVPGKITSNGIEAIATNLMRHSIIRNNYFMGVAIGINLGSGQKGLMVLDNYFYCDDTATGEAITVSGAAGNMFNGNCAMAGGDAAMTKTPYLDSNAAGNGWGMNYQSDAVTFPAAAAE